MLSACSLRLSAGVFGDDIPGANVEKTINDRLILNLQAQLPHSKFSKASCPERLNLSDGKVAHCSFAVDGVSIPVRVVYMGPDPQGFKTNLEGVIYTNKMIEQYAAATLAEYKVHAVVRCGPPSIRFYRPGDNFSCALSGVPGASAMRIRAMPNGQLFYFRPASLQNAASDKWMTDALHAHKVGRTVMVDGGNASKFIDHNMKSDENVASAPPGLVGKARCPIRLNLTGKARAVCTVAFGGADAHFTVWIDDALGFSYRALDAIIDKAKVQRAAIADLNRRLAENGDVPDTAVKCGPGLIVVRPPGTFYCKLSGNGLTGRLRVDVSDVEGTAHWRGVDMKQIKP
jgi:hypothetical protein